jgi:hypothetical protein
MDNKPELSKTAIAKLIFPSHYLIKTIYLKNGFQSLFYYDREPGMLSLSVMQQSQSLI